MQDQRLSVLVVDGSPAARDRIRLVLGEQYLVRFAGSPDEALAQIRADPPGLLVSEVEFVGGAHTGFWLCEQVRVTPGAAHLPILLLSERSATRDKVAGFHAGADDYVVKPLDPRLFPARLRLLARIKRLERPGAEFSA